MRNLKTLIPDRDAVLAMPPDQLGGILLSLVHPHIQSGGIFIPAGVGRTNNRIGGTDFG
jgi:hypothetical protein